MELIDFRNMYIKMELCMKIHTNIGRKIHCMLYVNEYERSHGNVPKTLLFQSQQESLLRNQVSHQKNNVLVGKVTSNQVIQNLEDLGNYARIFQKKKSCSAQVCHGLVKVWCTFENELVNQPRLWCTFENELENQNLPQEKISLMHGSWWCSEYDGRILFYF